MTSTPSRASSAARPAEPLAVARREQPATLPGITHMGVHRVAVGPADQLWLHVGAAGVILGVDDAQQPVAVAMFRPEPTAIVAVGGLAAGQLLAFRALAVGARITVETARPNAWQTFLQVAAGTSGAIVLATAPTPVTPGTANQPSLRLIDSQSSAASQSGAGAGYATTVTVHDQLTQWNASSLAGADLVISQRMSMTEARFAANALGSEELERALVSMEPDRVCLAARGSHRLIRIVPTEIESWLVGSLERRASR